MFKEQLHYLKKRHSTRFYKYFLSFVLPFVLVLLILKTIVYNSFIHQLQSEVEKSNHAVLTQVRNIIDMRMNELELMALNISMNDLMLPSQVMKGGLETFSAVKELEKYKSGNEFIYDIAIYYNYGDKNRMITTKIDTSTERYFGSMYHYQSLNWETYLNTLENLNVPVIRPMENIEVDGSVLNKFATYIYPFPLNVSRPTGYVMFLIEEEKLQNIIKNVLKGYNGYFLILDENRIPLFEYTEGSRQEEKSEIWEYLKYNRISDEISNLDINRKNYYSVQLLSDDKKWTYVTLIPSNQFMEKVYTTRNFFNIVTALFLILGILAAYVFATGQYRPIQNVMELIGKITKPGNIPLNNVKPEDEFKIICNTLEEVSRENIGLQLQVNNNMGMLKEQVLGKLIRGNIEDMEEFGSRCEMAGIHFDYPDFTTLVFLLDNSETLKEGKSVYTLNLVKFSLINVAEDMAKSIGYGYGLNWGDDRTVVLLLNLQEENKQEDLRFELAQNIKNFLKENFNITLTVAIGGIVNQLEGIRESFIEANRAMCYRLLKVSDCVISYKDIGKSMGEYYKYPVEMEMAITTAMKQGKIQEAVTVIEELKEYVLHQQLTPEAVQCICFGLINAIMLSLDEFGLETSEYISSQKENLYSKPFETMDELTDRLKGFCFEVCTYIDTQKESRNFELRDRILEYIAEHCRDHQLSIKYISDHFGISASYLSRFVKDQTGYTVLQHIDSVRMNEVKRLLKETKMPIKDILGNTGYLDESNFIRKFKQKEGITPLQFREIAQNNLK